MSEAQDSGSGPSAGQFSGITNVRVGKQPDGTFTATQEGLDVVGTGDSAARATEDMARQIAERQEAGEL